MFLSVGQTEHSSSPRLVNWILKSHTARRDIQAFCQKVNKHPLQVFDLQKKINKEKLKWRPNSKLLSKDFDPAEPSTCDLQMCSVLGRPAVNCVLQGGFNVQAK